MTMKTKLTRIGDSVCLVLDESLLVQFGVDESSEVELSTNGDTLIVTPVREAERARKVREVVEKVDREYADVFRRLADS
jgi:antitoxin MazE